MCRAFTATVLYTGNAPAAAGDSGCSRSTVMYINYGKEDEMVSLFITHTCDFIVLVR